MLYPIDYNDCWGYIDSAGLEVITPRFDWAGDFIGDCAGVALKRKSCLVGLDGSSLTRWYDDIEPFACNRAAFAERRNGDTLWGFLDRQENVVCAPKFEQCYAFVHEHTSIKHNSKWGVIGVDGEVVIEPRFIWLGPPSSQRVVFHDGGLRGILNLQGNIIVPQRFTWAWGYSEERCAIAIDQQYNFIDLDGAFILSSPADNVYEYAEGVAPYFKEGKGWGYVDLSGNDAIPCQFVDALPFSDGLALVAVSGFRNGRGDVQDGQWGFINKDGKFEIKPQFSYAEPFCNGLARVSGTPIGLGASGYYIDLKGNVIWPKKI